jgi:hypothetical protein
MEIRTSFGQFRPVTSFSSLSFSHTHTHTHADTPPNIYPLVSLPHQTCNPPINTKTIYAAFFFCFKFLTFSPSGSNTPVCVLSPVSSVASYV